MGTSKKALWIVLLLAAMLPGCTHIGPQFLKTDRTDYNYSIHSTENQQILLNLVRLRYTDDPYFLMVSSVVAQVAYQKSASLTALSNPLPGLQWSGSGTGTLSYTESPTITYIPLQGDDFVKQLLQPISFNVVYLLWRSGWGLNHLLRVMAQRVGNFPNAVNASRNVAKHVPEYKKFMQLFWVFHHLQYKDHLQLSEGSINGNLSLRVDILHYQSLSAAHKSSLKALQIDAAHPYVWLVPVKDKQPHHVLLQLRSIIGVLNYLSKSVDIPEYRFAQHLAPVTYLANGQRFDWRQVTKGMLQIKVAKTAPPNAYIAIAYEGDWYYVANNDYDSKETLLLLNMLLGFQQSSEAQTQPVFAIS